MKEAAKLKSIETEVLTVTSKILDKFVIAPKKEAVLSNVLIALRSYRNSTRWKEFFINNKQDERRGTIEDSEPALISPGSPSEKSCFSSNNEDKYFDFDFETKEGNSGLGTGAKPTGKADAPIGSPDLEAFLNELEEELIARVEDFFYNEKLLERFKDENEESKASEVTNELDFFAVAKN